MTFYSSKLIKKLLENKSFLSISLGVIHKSSSSKIVDFLRQKGEEVVDFSVKNDELD